MTSKLAIVIIVMTSIAVPLRRVGSTLSSAMLTSSKSPEGLKSVSALNTLSNKGYAECARRELANPNA